MGLVERDPTPWRLAESKGGQWYVYAADSEQPIKPYIKIPKRHTKHQVANARFIVLACNSHEQVLAACHAMCRVIAHEPERTLKDALLVAYEQMKAAINAAEGADLR